MTRRAHKIRLYPTKTQVTYLRQACGVARFSYNWGLARWNELYAAGEKVDCYRLRRELNAIKREQFPWMLEVTKCAPMESLLDLGEAWGNYFRSLKVPGGRRWQRPTFKRRSKKDAFRVDGAGNFSLTGAQLRLPRLGWVKLAEPLRWPDAKLLTVTVKLSGDRWYAVVNVELPEVDQPAAPRENQAAVVGVDLGLSTFATLSTGEKVEHPRYLRSALPRLRRLQQAFARKQKGSRNRERARRAVSRKYASVARQRGSFLHKLTSDISRRFGHVVVEDLAVQAMGQGLRLAKSVSDSGFAEFRQQLQYKAACLTVADRYYPSTKTCHVCRELTDVTLADRTWTCSNCRTFHDRDLNAALNLQHLGQTATPSEAISALAACGDLDGRSMKQEICSK